MLSYILFILSACAEPGTYEVNSSTKDESQVDTKGPIKSIELVINSIIFDENTNEMVIKTTNNLPKDTLISDVNLINPTGKSINIGKNMNLTNDYIIDLNTISFEDKSNLIQGEYNLELEFIVNEQDTNKQFLKDNTYGGTRTQLSSYYKDSKDILIDGVDDKFYFVIVKSNRLSLPAVTGSLTNPVVATTGNNGSQQVYIASMKEHAAAMSKEFEKIKTLFSNPKVNDLNWKVDVSVTTSEITRLSELPSSFDVPENYREIHDKYLNAMDLYFISMDTLTQSLDNNDAQGIEESSYGMELALQYVNEVFSELQQ